MAFRLFGANASFSLNFNLTNLNGSNGFAINGIVDGDGSGGYAIGSGDINGDGIGDVLIGAPFAPWQSTTNSSFAAQTQPPPSTNNIPLIAGVSASIGGLLCLTAIGISFYYYKRKKASPQVEDKLDSMELNSQEDYRHSLIAKRAEGHDVVGRKYALLNKITLAEADELLREEGIKVTFPSDKDKTKFVLGQGQFGKLLLARSLETGQFVGVKKLREKNLYKLLKMRQPYKPSLRESPISCRFWIPWRSPRVKSNRPCTNSCL